MNKLFTIIIFFRASYLASYSIQAIWIIIEDGGFLGSLHPENATCYGDALNEFWFKKWENGGGCYTI